MRATEYKKQFIEFLIRAWPTGLPAGTSGITVTINEISFDFKIDPEDYQIYNLNVLKAKSKVATKTSGVLELTDADKKFLEKLLITVSEDEEEQ